MRETELGLGISAVIPTRGDVDLKKILSHIRRYKEIKEVIVANYHKGVYNRYKGAKQAKYDIIYTQDDDCIVDLQPIINNYKKGYITNAIKADRIQDYNGDITLIGWGAIFDKELIDVLDDWEKDDLFLMECDRVFTALNKKITIPMKIKDMPWATDNTRMGEEINHWQDFDKIKQRIDEYKRFGV